MKREPASEVAELRKRYGATPRQLDDDLQNLAQGDRGCLGDAMAGVGALAIVVFGILAFMAGQGWGYMLIGGVLFLLGYGLSTRARGVSTKQRTRALTAGPLVLAKVVRGPEELWSADTVVAPATVVFCTEPSRAFDRKLLANVCDALKAGVADPQLAKLVGQEFIEGVHAIPEALTGGQARVFVATAVINGHRLPAGRLTDGFVPVIVAPELGFVEHI